jgi:hypothetical protein
MPSSGGHKWGINTLIFGGYLQQVKPACAGRLACEFAGGGVHT